MNDSNAMQIKLAEVVQNLKSHHEKISIKKLLFYASQKTFPNDIDTLNSISIKILVQKLYKLAPTSQHLKYILDKRAATLNKKEKYFPIAKIISNEMEKLYFTEQQPMPKTSIVNNDTAYQQQGQVVLLELEVDQVEQKVRATLEIFSANNGIQTRARSSLLSAPKIIKQYKIWQSIYRSLDMNSRLGAPITQITQVSDRERRESCSDSMEILRSSLINWYNSVEFSSIRESLLEKVDRDEEIRVIIRTQNFQLWQLPWHLFFERFLDNYLQSEVALSLPEYDQVSTSSSRSEKIKILAILGDSAGINIETDRQTLAALPNSETLFIVEPSYKEINDQLWEKDWDILFFAGHSSSQSQAGHIYINKKESLTIADLKPALKKAIARGLKLAIFNSCDGLKLARELASLNIPQIIVMREPVPDAVAQEFLKLFLKAFSGGKSLYTAVREARERLERFEKVFPGATCLPVICQNPATAALTWQEFLLPRDEVLLEEEEEEPIVSEDFVTPTVNSKVSSPSSQDWSFKLVVAWLNFYFKLFWILLILLGIGQLTLPQLFLLWGILFVGVLEALVSALYKSSANHKVMAFAQRMFSNTLLEQVSGLGEVEESQLEKNIQKYNEVRNILSQLINQSPELIQHFPEIPEINKALGNVQKSSKNIYEIKKSQREQREEAKRQKHEQRQKYWDKS